MAHDYIVVGAGSAGCAAAAGLVREHDASVLLLEAGPWGRDPRLRIPAAASDLWFGRYDWAYETEPQSGLGGRRDTWPRGRIVGGSSVINAMMYVRGMDVDFDGWEQGGAAGWGAAEMTAAFRRIEDDVLRAVERHGLSLLPFFPLESGLLTGKYTAEVAPDPTWRLNTLPEERRARWIDDQRLATVHELTAFAQAAGRSLLELAMSWLACQAPVASVIAGATRPEQIAANVAAVGWQLSTEELAEVDRITRRPATG